MTNFDLPFLDESHELFRDQVRRFVREEVIPHGDKWEKDGHVPRSVIKKMGVNGLLGVCYPVEYGGADANVLTSVVLAEELGFSTFGGFAITVLTQTDTASPAIASVGTTEQKQRYLPKITSGETLVAVAMTEPGAGSDLASLRTTARRDAGGGWVINGTKMFITNGTQADLIVVAARTNTTAKPSHGVSLFLVERGMKGFSVGRRLEKMGWRSSDTAELIFEDCHIPEENLLGELDCGFQSVMRNFENERLVLGAQAIGEAQAAIDLTLSHVRTRQAFGAVLWDREAIRQRLAMLATRVAAARHFVYGVAYQVSQGKSCAREVSMIKALCGELVNDVMYDCVQFHGGYGFITESTIERMYRDARIHSIGGGATEVMLEAVAKRM